MKRTLQIRNRQRVRTVDLRLLRQITLQVLHQEFAVEECELCLHLVAAPEMTRLNEQFLAHEGSTDVITFDYGTAAYGAANAKRGGRRGGPEVRGEIFVCLDDAVAQARRFGTTWQSELVRYVVHGLLHLRGHDDRAAEARREMKRAENRLMRRWGREFRPAVRAAR